MTLIRRTGFGDLLSLRQAMDRLFEESFVNPGTWQFGEGQLVPMDVYATDDEVVVEAILPGVKPEEVDITMEGNTLSIAGDTSSTIPDREGLMLQEIRRGRFIRTLTLPDGPGAGQGHGHVRGRRPDPADPQGGAGQAAADQDPDRPGPVRRQWRACRTPSRSRRSRQAVSDARFQRDPGRPCFVISVAASLVQAHPRTLRIYEDEGLLAPARTPTNIRLYSENDIRRILWIRRLTQERGVNLAGVKLLFELEERLGTRLLEALFDEAKAREAGAAAAARAAANK